MPRATACGATAGIRGGQLVQQAPPTAQQQHNTLQQDHNQPLQEHKTLQRQQAQPQQAAGLSTTQALQEFDLIFRSVQQSREPGVRREGLHALGTALHPLVQALLPASALTTSSAAPQTGEPSLTHADLVNAGDMAASDEPGSHQHEHEQQQQQQQQQAQHQHSLQQHAGENGSKQELCGAVARLVALAHSSSGAQQFDDIRLAAVKALDASGKQFVSLLLHVCLLWKL